MPMAASHLLESAVSQRALPALSTLISALGQQQLRLHCSTTSTAASTNAADSGHHNHQVLRLFGSAQHSSELSRSVLGSYIPWARLFDPPTTNGLLQPYCQGSRGYRAQPRRSSSINRHAASAANHATETDSDGSDDEPTAWNSRGAQRRVDQHHRQQWEDEGAVVDGYKVTLDDRTRPHQAAGSSRGSFLPKRSQQQQQQQRWQDPQSDDDVVYDRKAPYRQQQQQQQGSQPGLRRQQQWEDDQPGSEAGSDRQSVGWQQRQRRQQYSDHEDGPWGRSSERYQQQQQQLDRSFNNRRPRRDQWQRSSGSVELYNVGGSSRSRELAGSWQHEMSSGEPQAAKPKTLEPAELTVAIGRAQTLQDLQTLLTHHKDNLQQINICAAFKAVVKLSQSSSSSSSGGGGADEQDSSSSSRPDAGALAVMRQLSTRMQTSIRTARPWDLAQAAWACSKLQYRDQTLLNAVAQQVIRKAPILLPQDLAQIASAYARLKFPHQQLMQLLQQQALIKADSFEPWSLVHTAWSLEMSGADNSYMLQLLTVISQNLTADKVKKLKALDVATLLWLMASHEYYNQQILDVVCQQLEEDLATYRPAAVAQILISLAGLGFSEPGLAKTAAAVVQQQLQDKLYNPKQLAQTTFALVKMGQADAALLNAAAEVFVGSSAGSYSPRLLCMMCWAMQLGGHRSEKFTEKLVQECHRELPHFTADQLASIMRGMYKAPVWSQNDQILQLLSAAAMQLPQQLPDMATPVLGKLIVTLSRQQRHAHERFTQQQVLVPPPQQQQQQDEEQIPAAVDSAGSSRGSSCSEAVGSSMAEPQHQQQLVVESLHQQQQQQLSVAADIAGDASSSNSSSSKAGSSAINLQQQPPQQQQVEEGLLVQQQEQQQQLDLPVLLQQCSQEWLQRLKTEDISQKQADDVRFALEAAGLHDLAASAAVEAAMKGTSTDLSEQQQSSQHQQQQVQQAEAEKTADALKPMSKPAAAEHGSWLDSFVANADEK